MKLKVRDGTNLGELFGITLTPPDHIDVRYPFAPGTPLPAAGIGITVTYAPDGRARSSATPPLPGSSWRPSLRACLLDVAGTDVSLGLSADLLGLKLVIAPGEGDSFLREIIGDDPVSVDVPIGVEWRKGKGFRFKGSAAFEVTLHPHATLGPIRVDAVTVKLAAAADGSPKLRLELGAAVSGHLGPLQFMLDGVGVDTDVSFEDGNAGPFDIALGFKPPNGAGLALEGGGFTGGGSSPSIAPRASTRADSS